MPHVDSIFPKSPMRAVFTLRQVVEGKEPILFVVHEEEEGDWQFLNGKSVSKKDMRVVTFGEILSHDPSLHALSTLPAGWYASRKSPDHAWEQKEIFEERVRS
jgi:hypothetical protein